MIRSNVWEIEKEIRLHGQVEWRSKKNVGVRKNKNLCYLQPLIFHDPIDYSRYNR